MTPKREGEPSTRRGELHVFLYADCDWFVAHDADDARLLIKEMASVDAQPDDVEQWDDDRSLRIWYDTKAGMITEIGDDSAEAVDKPCREWATINGRGFLCSTEN